MLVPDLPESSSVSVAVDLVPDLTGDPDQELTHDFTEEPADDEGWASLAEILAGVLAVLVGLVFIATMGRRA